MKIENKTLFAGGLLQGGLAQGKNEAKNGKSIFGGSLNVDNSVEAKRKEARKQAMKVVGDAFAGEKKLDDEQQGRKDQIKELMGIIKDDHAIIKDYENQKNALRESMGIDADSTEQKGLELIEKRNDAVKKGTALELTDEEAEILNDIDKNGMTDYQKQALDIDKLEEPYKKEIEESSGEAAEKRAINREINKERLKSSPMVKATEEKDAIMAAASEEIKGMLIDQVKDHLDSVMEEQKEEADKKKEETEKKEEHLDKIKTEKAEEQARIEAMQQENANASNAASAAESQGSTNHADDIITDSTLSDLTKISTAKEDAEAEVKDIMNRMKLIEEDVKGAVVDSKL